MDESLSRRKALMRALAGMTLALAASACTTLAPLPAAPWASDDCTRWFTRLDAAVDAAGVMETHRITSVLVVDDAGRLVGALNSNDLMRAKVI